MCKVHINVQLHATIVQRIENRLNFKLKSIMQKEWIAVGRKEMSAYNLEHADVGRMQQLFELYDAEARSLLSQGLPIPA